jgi:hypothetical protein
MGYHTLYLQKGPASRWIIHYTSKHGYKQMSQTQLPPNNYIDAYMVT